MKSVDRRFVVLWMACLAAMTFGAAALALAVYAGLDSRQKAVADGLVEAAGPLPYLVAVGIAVVCGFLAAWLRDTYFQPLRRASRLVEIAATVNVDQRIECDGVEELRHLLAAVNGLGDRLRTLSRDYESRVREARTDLELERNRLAVLMSELPQGVIVCDPAGRIQLYNERARRLVRVHPDVQSVPGAYMGLGRSVYAFLSREGIEAALKRLDNRFANGELDAVEVLTTVLAGGKVLHVRVASLPAPPDAVDAGGGYVLLIDDVTAESMSVERRRVVLSTLLSEAASALALLRPAVDRLRRHESAASTDPIDATAAASRRLGAAVDAALLELSDLDRATQPEVEFVSAHDLGELALDAMRRTGATLSAEIAPGLATRAVRTNDLLQTLRYLGTRLRDEFAIREMTLRLYEEADQRIVALGWLGRRVAGATLAAWEDDPLAVGGEPSSMTLRELLQRQKAELTHDIDRVTGLSSLRLSLPPAATTDAGNTARSQARPVFFDFALPSMSTSAQSLSETPLADLVYTCFDTETTGLDPAGGDQIISIGAVRILNGRTLDDESFDQLIDTERRIDPEALKIHGIGPEILRGQPTLDRVLPMFHAFCDGTVLIGHNVAFDLRFIQLQEERLGVRFHHGVLDTLLLAGVLHDDLGDNRLEAIAHRLGIEVIGRHTALGDARVTAEVFLKMLPLLAARGIKTLGEAQRASEKTRYAKLAY